MTSSLKKLLGALIIALVACNFPLKNPKPVVLGFCVTVVLIVTSYATVLAIVELATRGKIHAFYEKIKMVVFGTLLSGVALYGWHYIAAVENKLVPLFEFIYYGVYGILVVLAVGYEILRQKNQRVGANPCVPPLN